MGGGDAFPSGKACRAPCTRSCIVRGAPSRVGTAHESLCSMEALYRRLCPPYNPSVLSRAHELRHHRALLVEVILHPVLRAFGLELGGEFLAQVWILHVI